jgi:hypothetical protein
MKLKTAIKFGLIGVIVHFLFTIYNFSIDLYFTIQGWNDDPYKILQIIQSVTWVVSWSLHIGLIIFFVTFLKNLKAER